MTRYFSTSLEISPGFLLSSLPRSCTISIDRIDEQDFKDEAKLSEFLYGSVPIPPRFLKPKPGDTIYILEAIGNPNDDPKKAKCLFFRIAINDAENT